MYSLNWNKLRELAANTCGDVASKLVSMHFFGVSTILPTPALNVNSATVSAKELCVTLFGLTKLH